MNRSLYLLAVFTCIIFSASAQTSGRVPLLEIFNGNWCPFGPDGQVFGESVQASFPQTITLYHHNSDAMSFPQGDTMCAAYGLAYPIGAIDRRLFPGESDVAVGRSSWGNYVNTELSSPAVCGVTVSNQSWNAGTRLITATVQVDFTGAASGDLRLSMWVAEDSVVGSGAGYDQSNYYNATIGHPYYGAGNPIVGFAHRYVSRACLGGVWGMTGVIPSSVSNGNSYTHTFTYNLPNGYDENKIILIPVVQQYNASPTNREVLNAGLSQLLGCNAPQASYTNSVSGFTVNFTDATTFSPTSWFWDFGDGSTSTQQNPTHIYATAGNYLCCLTTVNSCDTSTYCKAVQIACPGVNAAFTYATSGLSVAFANQSTASIPAYIWHFGDGNSSTLANPTHTYAAAGTYNVELFVYDSAVSCLDTINQTVVVSSGPVCNAAFLYSWSGNTLVLTNTSTGSFNTTYWTFGDGSFATGNSGATHLYAASGTYQVCVAVSDSNGSCIDTWCDSITYGSGPGPACVANFIHFPDTTGQYAIIGVNLSVGNNLNYLWDFGDGSTSTQAYPIHTYPSAGTYMICLVVNNATCADTFCDTVTVTQKMASSLTISFMGTGNGTGGTVLEELIQVFPNPFEGAFSVELVLNQERIVRTELFDLQGRTVIPVQENILSPGTSRLNFPTGDLSKGIYFLQIRYGNETRVFKLLKN
ncbi:MAG: PKD domain-containing protein [Bacteroidia bacterium]|nr:PKD domain-containing protein [Bacteroidia bacterium]